MEMDERFSHIAKDPRFRKIPNKKRKVKIDSRFQQMFSDKNFNTKYFVDKRGRKVQDSAKEDLSNFYELSDENDGAIKETEDDAEIRENNCSENEEKRLKGKTKKKKAKKENSTSDDKRKRRRKVVEDEVEGEFLDTEEDLVRENVEINNGESEAGTWLEFDADAPTTEDSTSRLAICNMDWDKITAEDLYVLLHSFVPSGGNIDSVKIYPSDFGLERMEREDETGPTELVAAELNTADANNQDEEYSTEKLREYQLNRLKYYYGVVECDSPATAEKIYEECDGMEYEASSSRVDLRFIPEDMTFDREPTSQATEMPSAESYKPSEFITTALQQSSVRLTWDETDPHRVQTTMRNFSKDDILDMDFKAYLASSSDEESDREIEETGDKRETEDDKIAKYKELLEEINRNEREEEGDQDMEITWEVGLKESAEELVKRKKDEKERKELTPWESYKNERKRKRKMKQQCKEKEDESQSAAQLSDDELPADVDLNDPYFAEELKKTESDAPTKEKDRRQKKKGKRKEDQETEEDKRRKAELQLLMMEEDDGKKHFNLKSIMKNEKSKKKRRKKQQETEQDDFKIDVNDSRFSAVYSSHLYAVDPSDPQFKKTKAMESIIREKQRRSNKKDEESTNIATSNAVETTGKKATVDPSLSALIKSVKSNAGKYRDNKSRSKTRKK
ncbi:ESF1 homolog [Dendronephthya gigantea]|uniref:ESF1 homolog n=1 Tax=Dendronephthya gigantea TaxID=151771 RepID=UPI00106A0DBC|nr:ESF1 homolog [Dendronephthya gigantea]